MEVLGNLKTTFPVDGMHCSSCEADIADAIHKVPGVDNVEVSLARNEARIHHEAAIDEDLLRAAVSSAGSYRLGEPQARPPSTPDTSPATDNATESLYPLFLVVAFIAGTVALTALASGDLDIMTLLRHFMAGFFIVFSFFKLLDPAGFVSAYRGYDVLARRFAAWAWAYPFVELGLGVAYLLNIAPLTTNVVTLIVMLLGSAGVLKALLDKRTIRCACLGTALKLPMTTVTLVEDLTMAGMAVVMMLFHSFF